MANKNIRFDGIAGSVGRSIGAALTGLVVTLSPAAAAPHETLTGVATCGGVPTSFAFAISRLGGLDPSEFRDPCRSRSGPCNEFYKAIHDLSRVAHGIGHIAQLDETSGWVTTTYDLVGTAMDIPPADWNRLDHIQQRYDFSATVRTESEDDPTTTDVQVLRYTDLHNLTAKVAVSLGPATCEDVSHVFRRYPPDD